MHYSIHSSICLSVHPSDTRLDDDEVDEEGGGLGERGPDFLKHVDGLVVRSLDLCLFKWWTVGGKGSGSASVGYMDIVVAWWAYLLPLRTNKRRRAYRFEDGDGDDEYKEGVVA